MTTNVQENIGIEVRTLIAAPLEKVFAYYADPSNLPEIWPSMLEVKDVETDDKGYPKSFSFVYKMAGMRFKGSTEVRDFEPNRRYVSVTKGGVESTFVTEFDDKDGKTEVYERVSYRIPIPLVGKIAEQFLRKSNENELKVMHANLKAKMESGA